VGDGRAGEATVVTGVSTMDRGMFLRGMSLIKTWSVISLVSWR